MKIKTLLNIVIYICIVIFTSGCGNNLENGKVYFEGSRFPRVKGKTGSSRGTSVYKHGRIYDLYNNYRAPEVAKKGDLLAGYVANSKSRMAIIDLKRNNIEEIDLPYGSRYFSMFPDCKKIAIV